MYGEFNQYVVHSRQLSEKVGPDPTSQDVEKKTSPRCTMALATRDLLVLLVAAVISLASFHWEASFDFVVGPTMSLHTNSGKTEFTNMYAISPHWQHIHWVEEYKIWVVPTDNSNLNLRLKARTDRFRS